MKIEKFVLGIYGTNCYIIRNEDTQECFIIDPGEDSPEMVSHIRREGLQVRGILLTHGHFDHILGLDTLLQEFPVPVYAYKDEKQLLNDATLNMSVGVGRSYTFATVEEVVAGQVLSLVGLEIQVIHTPGHTLGSACYYVPKEEVLFSGDTLFRASVGRTDFPGGNSSQLVDSIEQKLFTLPDTTKVYPGHMDESTIAFEKIHNPFL